MLLLHFCSSVLSKVATRRKSPIYSLRFNLFILDWLDMEYKKIKKSFESRSLKLNVSNVPKCPLDLVVLNVPGRILKLKSFQIGKRLFLRQTKKRRQINWNKRSNDFTFFHLYDKPLSSCIRYIFLQDCTCYSRWGIIWFGVFNLKSKKLYVLVQKEMRRDRWLPKLL